MSLNRVWLDLLDSSEIYHAILSKNLDSFIATLGPIYIQNSHVKLFPPTLPNFDIYTAIWEHQYCKDAFQKSKPPKVQVQIIDSRWAKQ